MIKLKIEGLTKVFDVDGKKITALDDINLEVYKNEFLTVVGPSGCGKTTLLRIIAGLDKPTKGRILLDGKEIKGPGADRGVVFQQYTLLPWRNVIDNIAFGLELRGVPKKERYEIARKFIKLMGLEGFEKAYPYQLSGGMQQRVAIARTLANDPEIVLMDEPFAALDAQTRAILQNELLKIWQKDKKTIFFITHSIDEAVYLSDRVVVLTARPGKIKDIIEIPLERPRDKTSVEFLEYKKKIFEILKEEVLKTLKR
ncbi:ABC transporter releated protein [Methanocaldococcus villosus KIN24-T80]|uniref:Molybdate/tungstate import ATP-binding protein WtpC n=1 Tax=Methanocaldococcus villosus KIN24-T80 TaxID=1069083 RepID=N6VPJ0_9EURY|nr:ABC transporter ATP-binding protein [Methanocaldococcus villosus]ENN95810.1 ABC transporter releated protein [Methanocaldococcus villosus KIN24-T80]